MLTTILGMRTAIATALSAVPGDVWRRLLIVIAIGVALMTAKIWFENRIEEAEERGVQKERSAAAAAALEQSQEQQEKVNETERVIVQEREVVRTIREKGETNVEIVYRDLPAACGISAPGVRAIRDTYSELTAASPGELDYSVQAATSPEG